MRTARQKYGYMFAKHYSEIYYLNFGGLCALASLPDEVACGREPADKLQFPLGQRGPESVLHKAKPPEWSSTANQWECSLTTQGEPAFIATRAPRRLMAGRRRGELVVVVVIVCSFSSHSHWPMPVAGKKWHKQMAQWISLWSWRLHSRGAD